MSGRRVAIYGGSFDPPHLGHVLSVAWALSTAEVDEAWIIPTWEHAFDKAHEASFDERMAMCRLAFAPFKAIELLDIERELGGTSRTLRTLESLSDTHTDVSFRLLIGADVLATTDHWHRWEAVTKLAPPLVVGRDGYPQPKGCPIAIPNVSSTDVRRAIEGDEGAAGLVPGTVAAYIEARGLYAGQR